MKNIRYGVFETNSSSTHSISISSNSDGILDTIVPSSDGTIVLSGGEFGWSWDKFNDPMTKANYCATDLQENPHSLHMLAEVICKHTGAKKVVFSMSPDYQSSGYSYVDHQSVGTSSEAFKNEETLKNFLFNPGSWLFTGNDNDYAPPNFYDVDKDIVYQYEMVVDGVEDTAKFVEYPDDVTVRMTMDSLTRNHAALAYKNWDPSVDDDNDDDVTWAKKKLSREPFKISSWGQTDVNDQELDTYAHWADGYITFYKTKPVYIIDEKEIDPKYNTTGKTYHGDEIVDTMKVAIKINKI